MTEESIKVPSWLVKTIVGVLVGGGLVSGGSFGGKALYDQYKQDHDLLMKLETKIEVLEDQVRAQWRRTGGGSDRI